MNPTSDAGRAPHQPPPGTQDDALQCPLSPLVHLQRCSQAIYPHYPRPYQHQQLNRTTLTSVCTYRLQPLPPLLPLCASLPTLPIGSEELQHLLGAIQHVLTKSIRNTAVHHTSSSIHFCCQKDTTAVMIQHASWSKSTMDTIPHHSSLPYHLQQHKDTSAY